MPMRDDDPFAVLGLDDDASLAEVRAARRRLAFVVHPDRGGDREAMQAVNVAFEACVAHLTKRRPLPPTGDRGRRFVDHDSPSFTVDALPAETFEALLVVLSWIGEPLDDDPPYVLECHLSEPAPCWCRLDLVPDAGGSTVSIAVVSDAVSAASSAASSDASSGGSSGDDEHRVSAEAVRDTWVHHLNRLGRPMP